MKEKGVRVTIDVTTWKYNKLVYAGFIVRPQALFTANSRRLNMTFSHIR